MPIFRSQIVVVLTIVACVSGAPSRIQDENVVGYMDALLDSIGKPEFENYNSLLDGGFMRLERSSLDSLSGATFGQSKKFDPNTIENTRMMHSKPVQKISILRAIVPKRNFDEIDRTNFDSFVKKNQIKIPRKSQIQQSNDFNEIDRFADFNNYANN